MKRIIYLFPGQGSQKIGMGRDFFDSSSLAKEMIEQASDRLSLDCKKLLFEPNDLLNQTRYTQPAILLVSAIAHALFTQERPIVPVYTLGHSLGEFSALVAAKSLDFLDGVELVHQRGKLMEEAAASEDGGMMVILGLPDEIVEKIASKAREEGKKVWPANYNSEGQIVLAGIKNDLLSLESVFKEAGAKRAMLLNMSVASHCPLMERAREPLKVYLEKFLEDSFICPVVSNVTAQPYDTKKEAVELLDRQLVEPVLYKQSIQNVQNACDLFIEFGTGSVLKGLNRRITDVPTINISDMKSLEAALEAVQ